eukprot:763448-Hanusia_phi.AAC.2
MIAGSDSRQLRGISRWGTSRGSFSRADRTCRDEGAPDNRKKRMGVRLPFSAFNIKPGENTLRIPMKVMDMEKSCLPEHWSRWTRNHKPQNK